MSETPPPLGAVYVLKEGRRLGPFGLEELLDGLENGDFSANEVCLREGATECERLRDLLDWDETPKSGAAETRREDEDEDDDLDDFEDEDDFAEDEDEDEDFEEDDDEEAARARHNTAPGGPPLRRAPSPDRIVYSGHPSVLTYPISLLALVGGFFGGLWLYRIDASYTLAAFSIAVAGLARLGYVRFTHDYLVRLRRVEVVTGFVARSSREVRIEDIRSINVSCRGLPGIFGIGTVDFITTGDAPEITFRKIWAARRIKALVRRLQDAQ